jgi:hypothetical protein
MPDHCWPFSRYQLPSVTDGVAVHLKLAPVALHAPVEGGCVLDVHLGDKWIVTGLASIASLLPESGGSARGLSRTTVPQI